MIITITCPKELHLTGIYKITNTCNNKYYIGSTSQSFAARFKNHIITLRANTHKNPHLQLAFNKYNEDCFVFSIVEFCDKQNCLKREQLYLDNLDYTNVYNINRNATGPSLTEETKQKQKQSKIIYLSECKIWFNKYKTNICTFEEIPLKYKQSIKLWSKPPWNKGKKLTNTNHLKVSHKKSDRTLVKNIIREKQSEIYVYDKNYKFYGKFRSAADLQDLSTSIILPIKSRFSSSRMGKSINYLNSGNINKACKTNSLYKGLYFTTKPIHQGIDDMHEPKSVKAWNGNAEVSQNTTDHRTA